jgi:uncharacterized protein YqeY
MSLVQRIKTDRIQAMKDKDAPKRSTLQLVLGQLEIQKIKLKLDQVEDLPQVQVEEVILSYLSNLEKEIQAYNEAGVSTDAQKAEKKLLLNYVPKQLTEEEVRSFVSDYVAGVKQVGANLGQIMKFLATELKGTANMSLVKRIAKEEFDK